MIGGLAYQFDTSPSRKVRVYINGEEVLEPARRIVDGRGKEIFQPNLNKNGVPKQDAFVIKVIRSRGNVPAIFTLEGWGPTGTQHGSRMFLENRLILSALAKFGLDSFEAVVVVDGVRVNKVDGTMTATGPLDIVYRERIRIEPDDEAGILAAFKNLPSEPSRLLTPDQIYRQSLILRGIRPR